MITIDVDDFTRKIECIYDKERYFVHDNRAILIFKGSSQ